MARKSPADIDMSLVEDNIVDEDSGETRGRNGRMRGGTHKTREAPMHAEVHEARAAVDVEERKLVAPDPREGYAQRWVYVGNATSAGTREQTNWATRMRQGWRPRAIETIPDAHLYELPMLQSAATGHLQMSGYILCEMPVEQHAALVERDNAKADMQEDEGIRGLAAVAAGAAKSLPNQKIYREVEVRVDHKPGRRRPPVMVE